MPLASITTKPIMKTLQNSLFQEYVQVLKARHEALISLKNEPVEGGNGIYTK